ncbi:hypothetical protein B8W69_00365 [Mycobacterium vulneris]|uniref:Uncharacterized protein n=1 Tax=Mycolicibacterium vulneris TaxID=547163 RepID=A0A1X2LE95_9MYCO|nr:hypothetical protein [Mycolicibacterium vulneris]OSC32286.1 hypothetical protein B8W69_00365 [Mycolicibacterium vulneris]
MAALIAPFGALFLALVPAAPPAHACPGATDGHGNDTRAAHDACCGDIILGAPGDFSNCNAGPMAPKELPGNWPCRDINAGSPACAACIRAHVYTAGQDCAGVPSSATRPARIMPVSFRTSPDACSAIAQAYVGNGMCKVEQQEQGQQPTQDPQQVAGGPNDNSLQIPPNQGQYDPDPDYGKATDMPGRTGVPINPPNRKPDPNDLQFPKGLG